MWRTRKSKISDQVFTIIHNYIEERGLSIPDGEIDLSSGFADFGLDSLDEFAIFAELEEYFNLSLDRKQALKAKYFNDLVTLVATAQESLAR